MTTAGEPLGTADRRGPAIGDDAARDAVARARAEELALVRFLYVDHGGIVRGKAVSADRLPSRARLHHGAVWARCRHRACGWSTTIPNSATASRRCRSATRRPCGRPTTTCCTGRACAA